MYAKVGQKISSGDIIAEDAMTENTTKQQKQIEIRINKVAIKPQNKQYN